MLFNNKVSGVKIPFKVAEFNGMISTICGFIIPNMPKTPNAHAHIGSSKRCHFAKNSTNGLSEDKDDNHIKNVESIMLNCAAIPGRCV